MMADGCSDDDVIHLASFNVHRSQGTSSRQRELITISDDSDEEEAVPLVTCSPVLVPDDVAEDDVSILEQRSPTRRLVIRPLAPARRHVIRPAAKWNGGLRNFQVAGQHSAASGGPKGDPDSLPSTSRDTTFLMADKMEEVTHPNLAKNSEQQKDGVKVKNEDQPTSTPAVTIGGHAQVEPSTSGPVLAGSAGHPLVEPQPSTSKHALAKTLPGASTVNQDKAFTSTQDNPQASTSSAQQPKPSTSAEPQPRGNAALVPQPVQARKLDIVILLQKPVIQASAFIVPAQQQSTPRVTTQPYVHPMQVNLVQIEPKPLAQAPAQPVVQPAQGPQMVTHSAVLIAAAPERLGPPEAGHRIMIGSQAAGKAGSNSQPQGGASNADINLNPPALPASVASSTDNRVETLFLAPDPNPEKTKAVPIIPVNIPTIEDPRPGPSVPRATQPLARTLITGVLDLFPDIQEAYVAELIQTNNLKDLNAVCNLLLESPEYPKTEAAAAAVAPTSILLESGDTDTEVTDDLFDYTKLGPVVSATMMQAADLLMADFRMISCQDIKYALNVLKGHYAITRKALFEAVKKWQDSGDPSGKRRRSRASSERCFIDFHFEHGEVKFDKRMYFLENDRRYCRTYSNLDDSLKKEVTFFQQKAKEWAEHEDFLLALQVNEDEYKKDGQLIECGCCYGEFAFEKMTQCSDGHLFCQECLVKYAQEAVFGTGKSQLSCMESGCTCSYPVAELEKVLPENILYKYYERQAEEAIAATCADELVRCPFCNFPALLDKAMSLFSCPNPRCRKESCRKCHVQWKLHSGKTCKQVLEKDEIRMRVLFEERMTEARVRKCVKCGTGLVKSEGCNRMSCRCGSFMCYLCREPIAGYNHFCQHARSPGAPCRQCMKCSLWTDPTQDDERIIQNIQKEGEVQLNKKFSDNLGKKVGPPIEAPVIEVKRPRVGPPPEPQLAPVPPPHVVVPPLLQAVQGPILVPQHLAQGQMFMPPAPYVPPPLNNNNHQHHYEHYHHHHHNNNLHDNPRQPHNLHMFDLPMHYGPAHRHYRHY
nr:E3 ubiquitin-protein ligase RNF216-like [Nerophis lumbriciformis]